MPSPKQPFNLCDYFIGPDKLNRFGNNIAIESEGQSLTYRDLAAIVDQWAATLSQRNLAAEDRIALLLSDRPDFVACFLASAKLGLICVPLSTFLTREDLEFVLTDSGAKLLVTEHEHSVRLGLDSQPAPCPSIDINAYSPRSTEIRNTGEWAATADTHASSPCFLLYTSGSTGKPKGVLHAHQSIPRTVECYAGSVLKMTPEDRVYSSSRLFFAYGLGNSLSFPLAAGATVVLDPGRPTPERVAAIFSQYRPTLFFGVPAVYNSLLQFKATGGEVDTTSLRRCLSAGEALPGRNFEDWKNNVGLGILGGIGSTEMVRLFISNRPGHALAGSSGQAVNGYRLRLRSDEGGECARGEAGHLWVNGASAFAGYWHRDELTQETLRNGWVRTGDLYTTDDEGFFFHVGRVDDCFKVRGLWVSPLEVESAILAHESVSEAAVVPSIDDAGLATARAFVVIKNGEPNEDLKQRIRETACQRLANYKVPSQIEFISAMPRTATGKVQRFKLRDLGPEGRGAN